MGTVPAPWSDHRLVAETISQAVSDAIAAKIGTQVQLGMLASCDPGEMIGGRPLPLHAIVVRMGRPLRDVMVFMSSLKEDVVRPLVEAAAEAAVKSLDIPVRTDAGGASDSFLVEDAIEFETVDEALEQCDALYLEAIYSIEMPTGELQMVLGTGLLEAATSLAQGVEDPFAQGQPDASDATDALGLGGDIGAGPADVGLVTDGITVGSASGLDTFDALLAEQEQADLASAPIAEMMPGSSPVEDAALLHRQAANRWTQLLSGVEVELSAELGRADLALRDITSLSSDSVLTLDQLVHEPVAVYVNGTRYATARLVVVDGEYGIEIIEVVDQSALTASLAA